MREIATPVLRQHRHLGVYGVCIVDDQILLVRKARGLYMGLFDLPGGGIEFGESFEDALKREFREEVGLEITDFSVLQTASAVVRYNAADHGDEEMHHLGILYAVRVATNCDAVLPNLKTVSDGEDSAGALWMPRCDRAAAVLTSFARTAVELP